jgi:hypothetical protein
MDWTTRVEPKHTRRFGVEEIHSVCFEPEGWPGKGPVDRARYPGVRNAACDRRRGW